MPKATLGIVLAALVTLVGCAGPSPSPSATPSSATPTAEATPTATPTAPPSASSLVLTANGMGTLAFGEAPSTDPATRMIVEDPAACAELYPTGSPDATRWRPVAAYTYPADFGTGYLFGVTVTGGLVDRIDLFTGDIPTDGGVRIGSTAAQVAAGHPSAVITEFAFTDIYTVTGAHGLLQIEVAHDPEFAYWEASQLGRVVYIHAVETGLGVFTVAASENIAGGCPA